MMDMEPVSRVETLARVETALDCALRSLVHHSKYLKECLPTGHHAEIAFIMAYSNLSKAHEIIHQTLEAYKRTLAR